MEQCIHHPLQHTLRRARATRLSRTLHRRTQLHRPPLVIQCRMVQGTPNNQYQWKQRARVMGSGRDGTLHNSLLFY